eukprot:COSAG02_NODE_1420_length_12692_cov_3.543397_8_plen_449_part_00
MPARELTAGIDRHLCRLGVYEVNLNPLPVHERVNPLSRTFSGPMSTVSSFDVPDLVPGGSARRRAARRKAKEWTAPKMGSFPWTDVRRLNGFKQFADPPRCVVSWDAYNGGKTEVPVHTTLERGKRTKYQAPLRSSSSQHRPRSRQRPLMGGLAESARRSATASREHEHERRGGRVRADGTAMTHFPPGRPRTADSMASSRSDILSRASARDAGLGSRGSSAGRTQPAPWDMLEFLESVERKERIPSVRTSSRGDRADRSSLSMSMNSSLGDTLGSTSCLATGSPTPSGRLSLPARPSTSAGFTSSSVFSTGSTRTTGKFEQERVIVLGDVPVSVDPADLAAVLSKTFGPLCYVSIQPSDDGGDIGWAIATFIEHGPAASAAAKGRVLLEVSTVTGSPEQFGLDLPCGQPPRSNTTATLPIDKLAFKVSQPVTSNQTRKARPVDCISV